MSEHWKARSTAVAWEHVRAGITRSIAIPRGSNCSSCSSKTVINLFSVSTWKPSHTLVPECNVLGC